MWQSSSCNLPETDGAQEEKGGIDEKVEDERFGGEGHHDANFELGIASSVAPAPQS